MFNSGTTELVFVSIVAFLVWLLIIWLLVLYLLIKPRQRQNAEVVEQWRNDDYRDYDQDDEDYLTILHTASQERLVPTFAHRTRTDVPLPAQDFPTELVEQETTDTRWPVPDAAQRLSSEQLAMELERDDYLTGRALRILRRETEERGGWHWDELTGTWLPGRDRVEALPFDDWLRELLEDREREEVPA